jgi:hypothetical protein
MPFVGHSFQHDHGGVEFILSLGILSEQKRTGQGSVCVGWVSGGWCLCICMQDSNGTNTVQRVWCGVLCPLSQKGQTQRQTDRQTQRQTDRRQTGRQAARQPDLLVRVLHNRERNRAQLNPCTSFLGCKATSIKGKTHMTRLLKLCTCGVKLCTCGV